MNPLEKTILRQLFSWRSYAEQVVPYLKEEYFTGPESQTIYKLFSAFYNKFKTLPSFAAIRIGLDTVPSLNEKQAKAAQDALTEIENETALDTDQAPWLLEETEAYCQDRAVYLALQQSIALMDDPNKSRHAIPDLMKEALSVSFDTHIGHDFFEHADERYDFYHKPEVRIPFDLDVFNKMTKGGVPKKTLNVVMAGTNVGKSLFLVHMAAACLRMNKNVLYITLEMAEERIAERIDANMMDMPIDDVNMLPKDLYDRKIQFLRKSTTGRLIVKEYPTASAHVGHFRALLQELRQKQNFVPDILFVDYISICASSRVKLGAAVNSYTLFKYVAEELRGLAQEFEIPVFSAAQFNREGFKSSDPSLGDVGESWAIPQTADFMFALVSTEELEKVNQIAVLPMKNRYAKRNSFQQQLIGIDTDRMKLYDLSAAQLAASVSLPPQQPQSTGKPSVNTFTKRRRPLGTLRKESSNTDSDE